jgi:AraC family L-rhamnose operon transcriptional activator RhaR
MHSNDIQTYRKQIGDGQIRMMRLRCRDDAPHRHSFFELVYVFQGTTFHHIGSEVTQLHAGDYFIIDPGSIHCYQNGNNCHIVNCLFLPEYIDRALADCPSLSSLLSNQAMQFGVPMDIKAADRVFHDTDGTVRRLIEAMEAEYATAQTGYMELLRCHLTQVLVQAVRAWETAEQQRIPHKAVAAVTDRLRANCALPLSLDALSREVGYTPQYLSTLFHRDTGMSIQEFLQRLRVQEACRLLGQKQLPLSDIAQTVGYSDAKHFSRVFRRYKGISPQAFRKSLTN